MAARSLAPGDGDESGSGVRDGMSIKISEPGEDGLQGSFLFRQSRFLGGDSRRHY